MKHLNKLLIILFLVPGFLSGQSPELSTIPDWEIKGTTYSELLGECVAGAGDVNGDGFNDFLVSASHWDGDLGSEGKVSLYYGTPDGPSATAAWTAEGNQVVSGFGKSIDGVGDVNGDGFDDILIGAYNYNVASTDDGAAFLYFGSPEGPSELPDWMGTYNEASSGYGFSVAGGGDLNNDGFDDIVIGCYKYGLSDLGAVFIYYGSSTGPDLTASIITPGVGGTLWFGYTVDIAGDTNGDGFDDVIIGAPTSGGGFGRIYLYFGSITGVDNISDWWLNTDPYESNLGKSVKGIGDVNNDGFDDFMAGSDNTRLIIAFYGNSGIPALIPDWSFDSYFDGAFDGIGDINNDGYDDVILISKRDIETTDFNQDEVKIFTGSATGLINFPSYIFFENDDNGGGTIIHPTGMPAGVGDINNDGYEDYIIGFPYDDITVGIDNDEGRVAFYYGGKDYYNIIRSPTWSYIHPPSEISFGTDPSLFGDINNDGINDFILSAPDESNGEIDEGIVRIYLGSNAGISDTPFWIYEGNYFEAFAGKAATGIGDINGDGFEDLAIGVYTGPTGLAIAGRVLIFLGDAGGLPALPSITIFGDQVLSRFGDFIEPAGDVNGDNYDDFLVSARYYDNGNTNEGRIYLYLGGATFNTIPDWTFEGNQNEVAMGDVMRGGSDINNDGFDDVAIGNSQHITLPANDGEIYFFYGNPSGLPTTPNFVLNTYDPYLGKHFDFVGDVNGDNFADVFVGDYEFEIDDYLAGASYIYFGSASGIGIAPNQTLYGNASKTLFGIGNSVKDFNSDGYDDISIYFEIPIYEWYYFYNNLYYIHPIEIYIGSAFGIRSEPAFRTNISGINYSSSGFIAALGDVTGDGFNDFIYTDPDLVKRKFEFPNFSTYANNFSGAYIFSGVENTCSTTPLVFSDITLSSVQITVTTPDFERLDYRYRKSGLTTWILANSNTTVFTITGLDSCSNYEIQSQVVCPYGSSAWGTIQNFTTGGCIAVCGSAPTGLFSNIISSTKVKVNWAAVTGATKYKVSYRKVGVAAWTTVNATGLFKTISGLTPATNYQWKVKAICGAISSPYSPINTFSTPARLDGAVENILNYTIYPNPNDGNFNVNIESLSDENINIKLFDLLGSLVFSGNYNVSGTSDNYLSISLPSLPNSIYILTLESSTGIVSEKISIFK